MKKILILTAAIFTFQIVVTLSLSKCYAQTWSTTGNSGTTPGTNFIGTTDAKDFVFKTNTTEKGRVKSNGQWQFGATVNLAKIDSGGNLSFAGNAAYKVAGNKYAFQYSGNPNYGLFFNSTGLLFEFRTSTALSVFSVGANTGNGIFKGNLKIGAYTLPATDGTSGQVLQTNGTGTVTWQTVSGGSGANTSLSNLATTSINQSLLAGTDNSIDLGSSSKKWRDAYFARKIYLNGSLFIHNTGTDCSWFGAQSGIANTGSYNCGIGSYALSSNTTGYLNTAIGVNSLYYNDNGNSNTALGEESMFNNINGIENVAVGYASLANNLGGSFNTAIGTNSLLNNNGSNNTAAGYHSLYSNLDGEFNTAFGSEALKSNDQGYFNTAIGFHALYNNIGGPNLSSGENTALGAYALLNNTVGNDNIAIGNRALEFQVIGNYNIAIGANAGPSSGSSNLENSIVIGSNTNTVNSNYALFGTVSTVWNGGNVQWATYSDGRIKTNVKEDVSGLAFITKLRPVTYYRNINKQNEITGANETTDFPGKYEIEKIKFTGFIAQEVETAANECGYDFSGVIKPKNENDLYSISYESFVVPLVKSVQELSESSTTKDSTIAQQQKQIESLNSKLDAMMNKMNAFENSLSQCCSSYHGSGSTNSFPLGEGKDGASLEQNVPNPFNQSSYIKYFAPSSSHQIEIVVSDMNGRAIKTFSNLNNGFGTVTISAGTFSAGTYQYTLFIDGNKIDTKEMILAK